MRAQVLGRSPPYQRSTSRREIDTDGGSRTVPSAHAAAKSSRLNQRASEISSASTSIRV